MNTRTVSSKTLWITWASLVVLLGLTWFAARFDLGSGNTIIALCIAGAKMLLVLSFFMRVRYSSRLVLIFACAGFIWWMIFISLAMTDYLTRQPVRPYNRPFNQSSTTGSGRMRMKRRGIAKCDVFYAPDMARSGDFEWHDLSNEFIR